MCRAVAGLLAYVPHQDLLRDAEDLKARGNDHFANSKADETLLEKAAECYRQALDRLPALESSTEKAPPPPLPASSGVVELTDAEAAAIEAQEAERNAPESDDERRRREANEGITQVRKALWANLGAVWVRKVSCSEGATGTFSLDVRRATTNKRSRPAARRSRLIQITSRRCSGERVQETGSAHGRA